MDECYECGENVAEWIFLNVDCENPKESYSERYCVQCFRGTFLCPTHIDCELEDQYTVRESLIDGNGWQETVCLAPLDDTSGEESGSETDTDIDNESPMLDS